MQTNADDACPDPIEDQHTDKLIANVIDSAAGAAPGRSIEDRYRHSMIALADHLKGGGGGEPPKPPIVLASHPWARSIIKWAIAGVFTVGMAYAGIRLAVQNNEDAIRKHAAKPMHDTTATEISEIKTDVSVLKTDVTAIKNSQTSISRGIESLKRERVEELKEELRVERLRNRRRGSDD